MRDDEKRAARAAYKERKSIAGIFAVRCAPSNQVWVGQSLNLASVQNRVLFALRFGTDDMGGLLAAWTAHSPTSVTFEELERLDDEETVYVRDKLLKERLVYWITKLEAVPLWR